MTIEANTPAPAITRAPRIRLGMVGGGQGAFIGAVHRISARLDDEYEFVAGALSSTPERAQASGRELGLAPERIYDDFAAMAAAEAARPDGVEAVSIVTPNHMHAPAAIAFLERGVHVICDKPLTASLAEARRLAAAARNSKALFILTHNYTAYPMIRQARAMVRDGELGKIRVIQVEYVQDWLTTRLEESGQKQAAWRTDPAQSGAGGATGDIGTHAYNLARFVSGLELDGLCADLTCFVDGRALDDDANVLLRFKGGAKGSLWCSQVAPGHENGLRLRIYGDAGGLEWAQEEPNHLWHAPFGQPKRLLSRNGAGVGPEAARLSRTPPGHAEGYLEGFANLYGEAARAIRAHGAGEPLAADVHYPTLEDGLEGVLFIDACVRSSKAGGVWVGFEPGVL